MNRDGFAVFSLVIFTFAPLGLAEESALDLFEQRIMPIFRSPNPSSCVQCHLSAVDLKDYILPSHEQTFVSLRDQGLIDVDQPEKSKILGLIAMGDRDLDAGARLIHAKTRQAEYDAFAGWVKACCNDQKLRNLPSLVDVQPARPAKPDPVIRHNRKDRVLDSFVRNVWSQRMRCFPCHTPYEVDADNPQHRMSGERHREFVQQYGQRMNIFRQTPEATMRALIVSNRKSSSKALPLLNVKEPQESLLVMKPTSKLPNKDASGKFQRPSSLPPVSHMGGLKMHVDDQSYKSFLAWIEDYARVVGDQYTSAESLPRDNWFPSQHVLRVKDTPASWPVSSPVQLCVHAWNKQTQAWESDPIAFTQGTVTPRNFVNGTLFLLTPPAQADSPKRDAARTSLPPGKYLIKAYVDSNKRLAEHPAAMLPEADFAGQVAIQAKWKEGFPLAEVVSGAEIR